MKHVALSFCFVVGQCRSSNFPVGSQRSPSTGFVFVLASFCAAECNLSDGCDVCCGEVVAPAFSPPVQLDRALRLPALCPMLSVRSCLLFLGFAALLAQGGARYSRHRQKRVVARHVGVWACRRDAADGGGAVDDEVEASGRQRSMCVCVLAPRQLFFLLALPRCASSFGRRRGIKGIAERVVLSISAARDIAQAQKIRWRAGAAGRKRRLKRKGRPCVREVVDIVVAPPVLLAHVQGSSNRRSRAAGCVQVGCRICGAAGAVEAHLRLAAAVGAFSLRVCSLASRIASDSFVPETNARASMMISTIRVPARTGEERQLDPHLRRKAPERRAFGISRIRVAGLIALWLGGFGECG